MKYIFYYNNSIEGGKGSGFHFPNFRVALTSNLFDFIGAVGYKGSNLWYYKVNDITRVKQWSTKQLAILLQTK